MKKYKCSFCSDISKRILAPASLWKNGKNIIHTYAFTCEKCKSFNMIDKGK